MRLNENKLLECDMVVHRWKMSKLGNSLSSVLSKITSGPYTFKGKLIKVVRAPEPSDVLWENLGY